MTGLEAGPALGDGVRAVVETSVWMLTGLGAGVTLGDGVGAVGTSGRTGSGTLFACCLAELSTE